MSDQSPKLVAIKRPPSDLAEHLRFMADEADAGRLTDFITCYVLNEEFVFKFGTSKLNCIAMASMLHAEAVENMRL